MEYPNVLFSTLKTLRLKKQWSQEMLAEMTGLSVRTIQRIEQGHKASLESTKALNAIFEVQFVEIMPSTRQTEPTLEEDIELKEEKEKYSKEVKEFINQASIGGFCILTALAVSIMIESWHMVVWTTIGWLIVLAEKGRKTFSFVGDSIEDELMKKKFKNKKTHE